MALVTNSPLRSVGFNVNEAHKITLYICWWYDVIFKNENPRSCDKLLWYVSKNSHLKYEKDHIFMFKIAKKKLTFYCWGRPWNAQGLNIWLTYWGRQRVKHVQFKHKVLAFIEAPYLKYSCMPKTSLKRLTWT